MMLDHDERHDPTVDYPTCTVCQQALHAAFAHLADLDLGPRDADALITTIRRLAEEAVAHGAAA